MLLLLVGIHQAKQDRNLLTCAVPVSYTHLNQCLAGINTGTLASGLSQNAVRDCPLASSSHIAVIGS